MRSFVDQHVIIVELRHIFGCIENDDGTILTIKEEMEIFERV